MSKRYPIKVVCESLDHSDVVTNWQFAFIIGREYYVKEDNRDMRTSHLKYIWKGCGHTLIIPRSRFRVIHDIPTDPIEAHNIVFNPKIETNE